MTARDDLDRQLDAYLLDGPTELPEASFFAVRDRTETARQRVVFGPWRTPDIMSKLVPIGLGAAAVVAALVIGSQLLGPVAPSGVGGGPATPTPAPTPTVEPSASAWTGLAKGPFLVTGSDGAVDGGSTRITVDIASTDWTYAPELDYVGKNDDGLDAPQTVGALLIAWAWPAGTRFDVYGDPCHWSTSAPETPATTPDEIAAAFAAQTMTDPTTPIDVTVGGYTGKAVTLRVPMSYEVPGATREEEFAECDQNSFFYYGIRKDTTEGVRNAQGPGQIDELWILDVNGEIVILDASYSPATPAQLVDEMRAMVESATFE